MMRSTIKVRISQETITTSDMILYAHMSIDIHNVCIVDQLALEVFGVLPGEGDCQSPFEASIAQYLSKDFNIHNLQSYATLECVSTLGLMLLERIIYHAWTEGGRCIEAVPFTHYWNSSKFVKALGALLNKFASHTLTHLDDNEVNSIREICSNLVRERYSRVDDVESPRSHEESAKMIFLLQRLYPSNFIDNAGVLTEIIHESASNFSEASGGDLYLYNNDTENFKFNIQSIIHLRSLVGCIQDLYDRVTLVNKPRASRWHAEDGDENLLSFRTMEEADEMILSMGGIQTTRIPDIGTDIDLRGRKYFPCSLPRKSMFARNVSRDIIIDSNGAKIVVTEKAELVLVIDPSEVYISKAKREDSNRCTVVAVIPLRTIIACATEVSLIFVYPKIPPFNYCLLTIQCTCQAESFHIVCNTTDNKMGATDIIKNGTLSLKFEHSEACLTVKECLDKHCAAYEKKIVMDMTDMLEKCSVMANSMLNSTSQTKEAEDTWCDFQQA